MNIRSFALNLTLPVAFLLVTPANTCHSQVKMTPPIAKARPKILKNHGTQRTTHTIAERAAVRNAKHQSFTIPTEKNSVDWTRAVATEIQSPKKKQRWSTQARATPFSHATTSWGAK